MLKLKLQYFGHLMQRVGSLEKPWCWEELGAGGEGDDRGWNGWMASATRWTWVWVNSGSWWWTGRPGVLRLMGSQRVRHDWATELTDLYNSLHLLVPNHPGLFLLHHPSSLATINRAMVTVEQSVLYVSESVSVLSIASFVSYFRFHI